MIQKWKMHRLTLPPGRGGPAFWWSKQVSQSKTEVDVARGLIVIGQARYARIETATSSSCGHAPSAAHALERVKQSRQCQSFSVYVPASPAVSALLSVWFLSLNCPVFYFSPALFHLDSSENVGARNRPHRAQWQEVHPSHRYLHQQ